MNARLKVGFGNKSLGDEAARGQYSVIELRIEASIEDNSHTTVRELAYELGVRFDTVSNDLI